MTATALVFIDARLANPQALIAGLPEGTEWFLLNDREDGVGQMQHLLAEYTGLDSVQIVSHGSPGTLWLGSTRLDASGLADHQVQLAAIGASLAPGGDLLLYGCNVGAGVIGQRFVATLAQLTGADVAASDDLTGSAALGGDWVLETTAGTIETRSLVAADYDATLAYADVELSAIDNGIGGFVINGQDTNDRSGLSVAGAGDVNGDGLADLIVGAPGLNDRDAKSNIPGRSYVVFGKADVTAVDLFAISGGSGGFVINGQYVGDNSGASVAGAGDVNGDGLADLIVGALYSDPGDPARTNAGRSYVVFGKSGGSAINLSAIDGGGSGGFVINGQSANDNSGLSVAGAGDVNGDGLADLAVGAIYGDPDSVRSNAGRSYVVFGKTGGAGVELSAIDTGVGGFVINGQSTDDWSGLRVAGAGDVNGDGLADLIVGARMSDPGNPARTNAGRSYVVFGKTAGKAVELSDIAMGSGGFVINGRFAGDASGDWVSGAGDVNGDGLADLIVGAPGSGYTGLSYVVFGKADGTAVDLATILYNSSSFAGGFVITGQAAGDASGRRVAGAGDVNGDGLADLIVGAFGGDPAGRSNAGRSYVVFGKTGGGRRTVGDRQRRRRLCHQRPVRG